MISGVSDAGRGVKGFKAGCHSRVVACHGFDVANGPLRRLWKRLKRKRSWAVARKIAA